MCTAFIGKQQTFKTTLMLSYAYELNLLHQNIKILYVAPIMKLEKNTFYFGKYKELDVACLDKIDVKYLDNFRDLYLYLVYFKFLDQKYDIVIFDDINLYIQDKDIQQRIKKVTNNLYEKLNLIFYLISNIKQYLKQIIQNQRIFYCLDERILNNQVQSAEESFLSIVNLIQFFGHETIQVKEKLYVVSMQLMDNQHAIQQDSNICDPLLQELLSEMQLCKLQMQE